MKEDLILFAKEYIEGYTNEKLKNIKAIYNLAEEKTKGLLDLFTKNFKGDFYPLPGIGSPAYFLYAGNPLNKEFPIIGIDFEGTYIRKKLIGQFHVFIKYPSFDLYLANQLEIINDIWFDEKIKAKIDYALSSIPFLLIKDRRKHSIIRKTKDSLGKNGKFIVYQQYSWHIRNYLSFYFKKISTGFEIRNIPPTFIYRCEKAE